MRGVDLILYCYALLESGIRPDIQLKSTRSHEAEPSVIWMTEGGFHFPTGRNEFITCSFMISKKNKYISMSREPLACRASRASTREPAQTPCR